MKGSVIVIGAGPGLGSSLARKFAKEDHHVFVVRRERHSEELNSLCDEMKEFGGSATAIPSDAREEEQVISLFSEVAKSGPIDCVVFNIGANVFFSIEETTSRVFRKIWEMGTFAGFLVGREAAKHMKDKGTIIFTGATASMRGGSGFAAFSSAKFGLRAVAQSLARELGPKGIHVAHTIIDGAIDHPWIKENFPDIYKLKEVDGILNPDDIAEAYYNLHLQEKTAWTHELDLRPYMEKF